MKMSRDLMKVKNIHIIGWALGLCWSAFLLMIVIGLWSGDILLTEPFKIILVIEAILLVGCIIIEILCLNSVKKDLKYYQVLSGDAHQSLV